MSAKKRRAARPVAKAQPHPPSRRATPASRLARLTTHGLSALGARLERSDENSARGAKKREGPAVSTALERLQREYERVLGLR